MSEKRSRPMVQYWRKWYELNYFSEVFTASFSAGKNVQVCSRCKSHNSWRLTWSSRKTHVLDFSVHTCWGQIKDKVGFFHASFYVKSEVPYPMTSDFMVLYRSRKYSDCIGWFVLLVSSKYGVPWFMFSYLKMMYASDTRHICWRETSKTCFQIEHIFCSTSLWWLIQKGAFRNQSI